jgi:type I restriction enzyme, R subunit
MKEAAAVDHRLTLREILEKILGFIPHFKSKDELPEEEFFKLAKKKCMDSSFTQPHNKYREAHRTS